MAMHSKKGLSASQTRRTSRRVNDSVIGSHVERRSGRRGGRGDDPAGTSRVDFSDSRRSRRATRGMVDQVDVQATSGESDADYARRRNRRGYVEEIQARSRRRSIAGMAAVAVAVLAVALVAGVWAFFALSDSQLSLGDSNAEEALVAPPDGEPYFALCTASLGAATPAGASEGEAYLAVRVDEASHALAFVSVPATVRVELSDGQSHPLSEARAVGGDAELIRAVAGLLGVDIAHFARTDAEGIAKLVDIVGGVAVELDQEVDDPRAGTQVLKAGQVTLDGDEAITLLRAANYADPYLTQAKMRALFTVNLAERASSGEGLSFASVVADGAPFVSTDWSSSQIIALGDVLRPVEDVTVYATVVPGRAVATDGGSTVYEVSEDDLAAMMEAVRAGNAPESAAGNVANVDRSLVTVEVRNGSGIQGAAARCGELLESDGYQVEKVGNVDDATVYPETMVIYKDAAFEVAAKAVVSDLSSGRVVNGGDFYTFDTDILVIIGQDWIG